MVLLVFSGTDNKERFYEDCSLGSQEVEEVLEIVTSLVQDGWSILGCELALGLGDKPRILPPEIFDGTSFVEPIAQLQQQWQSLLKL